MKNKILLTSMLLFICLSLTGVYYLTNIFTTKTSGDHRNIADLTVNYNADKEIATALEQLKNNPAKAGIITQINSNSRQIALTFDGLSDRTTIQRLLDILKKYNAKATFFADGIQAAEDPQTVVNIRTDGQQVENYTLHGMVKMEKLSADRLVKDFSRAQKILKVIADKQPNLLKCNSTQYTDPVLQAAKASGFSNVVKSSINIDMKQINTPAAANSFVSSLRPGSIISIKLKPNVQLITDEEGKTDDRPAVDKQPGLKILPTQLVAEDKELFIAVENLLTALHSQNYKTAFIDTHPLIVYNRNAQDKTAAAVSPAAKLSTKLVSFLRDQISALFSLRTAYAAKPMAEELKIIPTTEPALSYSFGGLSNLSSVNSVLEKLQELDIKGTFFVLEVEMRRYPRTLQKIIDSGHEIGIAIRPNERDTAEAIQETILSSRNLLKERFGVETNLVKQPWGVVTDAAKTAVSTLDCTLIGHYVNVVQSKHKDYESADQVMGEIFGKSVHSLGRGQIVHFRMDYYTNSRLTTDLVEAVKRRKVDNIAYATSFDNPIINPANNSQYIIKPVGQVLKNQSFRYQYPVKNVQVFLHERSGLTNSHKLIDEVSKRYIGNPEVTVEDRVLGFSKMESRRLDTTGLIHTDDNVIFITFDDWGTDAAINKLLYVLRKHKAHANFFIITNNVLYNPNLLRSIAVEGHAIGSHSDLHQPMAVRDPKTGKQVRTQDKDTFRQDLSTSFSKLQNVVGDVTVNGRPALTRIFRPATLAISKMGFESLLGLGYDYIINGSCSTYDYKAENVSVLVRTMKDGIYTKTGDLKKGAVLVMHMSDNSLYTAMALDILLTANAAKADSDPTKFKLGRLTDYLPEGYSQVNRQHSLQLNRRTPTN